jgi:hypothetical protein
LHIAQKLGYISVFDSLKPVTEGDTAMSTSMTEEKYRVVAPEAMHETFMSDSEEEGQLMSPRLSAFVLWFRLYTMKHCMSQNYHPQKWKS